MTPVTRWWLEGTAGLGTLCLVTETGAPDDPPCPLTPPERPGRELVPVAPYFGRSEDVGAHAGWLSSGGVGVQTSFGDGAHGWIESISTMRRFALKIGAFPARSKKKRAS